MTATMLKPAAIRIRRKPKPLLLRFRKILAPVDFSPASTEGLQHALLFAEEFGAEITLLYVLETPATSTFAAIPGAVPFSELDFSSAEKNLRALVAGTVDRKIQRPKWKVRVGVPSHEIVEEARESDTDLIVIATHGYTGWKHFCIGSTTERVVRAASCPVFAVREKEHEFC